MENSTSSNNNLDNPLFNLLSFYHSDLQPFVYEYKLPFGIDLNFTFEPDKIPHLIFGTVTGFRYASQYKGQTGYDNIMSGEVTSVPSNLREAFNGKSKGFKFLPQLLESPTIYHYNKDIVQSGTGSIRGFNSVIDADFLLHKGKTHLFVKWTENEFVPVSIIFNKSNTYIINQINMKVLNDKSTFKCYRKPQEINLTSVI